jgi:hypothetical protein
MRERRNKYLVGMRHGSVAVQLRVLDHERVVCGQGHRITHHAMEARGILVRVRHACVAPQVVAKDGIPVAGNLPDKPKIAVRAAVGELVAEEVDAADVDRVGAVGLRVVWRISQHHGCCCRGREESGAFHYGFGYGMFHLTDKSVSLSLLTQLLLLLYTQPAIIPGLTIYLIP